MDSLREDVKEIAYVDFTPLEYLMRLKTIFAVLLSLILIIPVSWLWLSSITITVLYTATRQFVFLVLIMWLIFFILRFSESMQIYFALICSFFNFDTDYEFFFFLKYALICGVLCTIGAMIIALYNQIRPEGYYHNAIGLIKMLFSWIYVTNVFMCCMLLLEKGNFSENIKRVWGC
jgi:hypothetical protein